LFDSPARWAGVAGWVDGAKESPGGVIEHHLHPNPRGYNRMAYCQGDAISHNVCSTPLSAGFLPPVDPILKSQIVADSVETRV